MAEKKAAPDLEHLLSTAGDHDQLDVNIFLRGEPRAAMFESLADAEADDASSLVETLDRGEVVGRMKTAAESAQAGLLSYLQQQVTFESFTDDDSTSVMAATPPESFWITNAIGTRVTATTLREILDRDDVEFVDLSRHVPIEELIDAKAPIKKKKATPKKKATAKKKTAPKAKHPVKKAPAAAVTDDVPGAAVANAVAWSVSHINAPLCWQKGLTGKGILVALVDTGVNYDHPDLKNRMWKGNQQHPHHGFDFENNDNDPSDDNGHGTATAGQVAGDGTSGTKTGVAPEATILAIRVGGVERNFWKGLQFALDQKAQVISMSMTWKHPKKPDYPGWRRVCETILAAGVLHANSTGNQGDLQTSYPIPFNIGAPGNCPPPWLHPLQKLKGTLSSPISVGATDSADWLADNSGRGPASWNKDSYVDYPYTAGHAQQVGLTKPDICAPGPGTTSCNHRFPNQAGAKPYRSFSGTSAATPHVGGCLAILAQACIQAGQPIVPARVQEALEQTAKRIQGQTKNKENHYGAGRVDVYAAYGYGKDKGWW